MGGGETHRGDTGARDGQQAVGNQSFSTLVRVGVYIVHGPAHGRRRCVWRAHCERGETLGRGGLAFQRFQAAELRRRCLRDRHPCTVFSLLGTGAISDARSAVARADSCSHVASPKRSVQRENYSAIFGDCTRAPWWDRVDGSVCVPKGTDSGAHLAGCWLQRLLWHQRHGQRPSVAGERRLDGTVHLQPVPERRCAVHLHSPVIAPKTAPSSNRRISVPSRLPARVLLF